MGFWVLRKSYGLKISQMSVLLPNNVWSVLCPPLQWGELFFCVKKPQLSTAVLLPPQNTKWGFSMCCSVSGCLLRRLPIVFLPFKVASMCKRWSPWREWIGSFAVETEILPSIKDCGFLARGRIIFIPIKQFSQSSVRQSNSKVKKFIFPLSGFDGCCILVAS